MELKAFAEELIQSVEGISSEKNIKEVVGILDTIKKIVNENWELHLAAETNEKLMYDAVNCSCGTLIEVHRTRQGVEVIVV